MELSVDETDSGRLHEIIPASGLDLQNIWGWNAVVPATEERCVHDLIIEIAARQPKALAVYAWDGELTYGELDALSTRLAHHIVGYGVGPGSVVPLCFEKSMWTTVAMLAVMKAGAASVAMDVTIPEARLRAIVGQVETPMILSSINGARLASRLHNRTYTVSTATLTLMDSYCNDTLPVAAPSACLYVVFTSGSTGVPKGAVITHANFVSAIRHQQHRLMITKTSRVYDFASYAFDVAWSNVLHTLSAGGCLCVPSEGDRASNLEASIVSLDANYIHITPTVSRTIDRSKVTNLRTINMIGEPLTSSDVQRWSAHLQMLNTYGPAECAVTSTLFETDGEVTAKISIGKGLGLNTWIVDAGNHTQLVSVGCVGELLLEGPLVGAGYLNDPEKTAAAFIEDPPWLLRGGPDGIPGRRGRLYKTGDLVRYNEDGSLQFVGRKDQQVKIRGQRVELGEVEHHVQRHLVTRTGVPAIVAEVVTPADRTQPMLVVFVELGQNSGTAQQSRVVLEEMITGIDTKLAKSLPIYMVPGVYIAVKRIPMTATGKTDRRRLREIGGAMTLEELTALHLTQRERRAPTTKIEELLQQLWARVLVIDINSIAADDSFLRVGGDSIAAMQLVGAVREQGLSLTVADVFRQPRLCDLATLIEAGAVTAGIEPILPFSLLGADVNRDNLCVQAAALCSVKVDSVEDIFPCTPLQKGLLAMTAKRAGDYIARHVLELRNNVDVACFQRAVETVARATHILRTRIVSLQDHGLMQVVIDEAVRWSGAEDVPTYLARDQEDEMSLCVPLSRYGLVEDARQNRRFFVWTLHHALYDGWSMPLLYDALEVAYSGQIEQTTVPFQAFVKHVAAVEADAAVVFWKAQLEESEAVPYPALPSPAYQPQADGTAEHDITELTWRRDDITASTAIRAAWAILSARYTDADQAVFGATVTGRQAPVAGVERMIGPTIATVPVRVQLDGEKSVDEVLQQVQMQAVEMTAFEQFGLQQIRRINAEVERGSQFHTLLVIQPREDGAQQLSDAIFVNSPKAGDEATGVEGAGLRSFNTYALMIVVQLEERGVRLQISFDSNVIESTQVRRLAQQFEHVLRQVCAPQNRTTPVADLETASEQDLRDIWTWNATVPATVERCVHDLIAETAQRQPGAPAVCAWDGELTYGELDDLSTKLAHYLVELGVKAEDVVPLCFEKSMWTVVAMLAVLKAGGAFVQLDPDHPTSRHEDIFRQTGAQLVLTSTQFSMLWVSSGRHVVTVGEASTSQLPTVVDAANPLVEPRNAAYIIFTSGSTGVPKGVVLEHSAVATSCLSHGRAFGMTKYTRVLQFASYTFDACIAEIITTLVYGGCICVLSESDRRNDLAKATANMDVNWAFLTPSVARLLDPILIPSLKILVVGGEQVNSTDWDRWPSSVQKINGYGPTECCVFCVGYASRRGFKSGIIGTSVASVSWVVDLTNHNRLAPLGSIGELLVEGPILARGYLNDADKTAAAFIDDPAWLLEGCGGHGGRRGRLYKTGDLVRYDSDGNLVCLGRKDGQIKVRGQRVELGEVEHHVRECLPEAKQLAVEVIVPEGEGDHAMLAAFVQLDDDSRDASLVDRGTKTDSMVRVVFLAGVEEELAERLPGHMVPTVFFALVQFPVTTSGKMDRKRLQEVGVSFTAQQLAEMRTSREGPKRQPSTEAERTMQQLWARVLGIDVHSITADDSFLRLGGDSIGAMRLVAAARDQGLVITVADVFQQPQLCNLAKLVKAGRDAGVQEVIAPFSLLRPELDRDDTRVQAAILCGVEPDAIEDVFPCTPLQEGLLAMTARRAGDYVAQRVYRLRETVEMARFQAAVDTAVRLTPILRTRVIDLPGQGLVQVVVGGGCEWVSGTDLQACAMYDGSESMSLGTPLSRYSIVGDKQGQPSFVWTLHHALYDGWSMPLMMDAIARAYLGQELPASPPFQAFVRHVCAVDEADAVGFWHDQLANSEAVCFPTLPSPEYVPCAERLFTHQVAQLSWLGGDITAATTIRAAWAILACAYTGSTEAMFGATVTGRQAAVPKVERLRAPTFATVPVHVSVEGQMTVGVLLQQVQAQVVAATPFEQLGLPRIRRISEEVQRASQFQTLLIIQPGEQDAVKAERVLFEDQTDEGTNVGAVVGDSGVDTFNTYAIMLFCQLEAHGVRLRISFDSKVIDGRQVQRLAQQFEHVLRQVCVPQNRTTLVADLETASEQDLRDIWTWNATVPAMVERCVHDLIAETAQQQPSAPAVCAWDGELTYGELDDLSTRLAHHLIGAGVKRGMIVLLCFEKSLWAVVTMLGVMKAGAMGLLLSSAIPASRVQRIAELTRPHLALVSASRLPRFVDIVPFKVIEPRLFEKSGLGTDEALPVLTSANEAILLFTSGSTGYPKGIVWDHAGLTANVLALGNRLNLGPHTRLFQFAAYDFDVSIVETLGVLTSGGCVCVPSESERMNAMVAAMNQYEANTLCITPSASYAIAPDATPAISTIVFAGEPLQRSCVCRWLSQARVYNWYGPAEASFATCSLIESTEWQMDVIGRSSTAVCWVIDTCHSHTLAAIGAVGELVIEGPMVAKGYLNEADIATAAFMEDPPWLVAGGGGVPGRHGRLYRTGDLVRYNTDGSLHFIGRKDAQVKIRGQRVELSEVEHHVERALAVTSDEEHDLRMPLVAEVVTPQGGQPTLVVFADVSRFREANRSGDEDSKKRAVLAQRTIGIDERLAEVVPAYMIPAAYVAVRHIPLTATGKTDRRQLRKMAECWTTEELADQNAARAVDRRPPSTSMERQLQALWAQVLGVSTDSIAADDSFLRVGGDSIQAMRLVAAAREQDLSLTVADVFAQPRLSRLAVVLAARGGVTTSSLAPIAPFALLNQNMNAEDVRQRVARLCAIDASLVEDVFPCTPLQGGLLAMTARRAGDYVARSRSILPSSVDIARLREAFEQVAAVASILRTRIVDLEGQGLVQVVVNEPLEWNTPAAGADQEFTLGSRLTSFSVCRDNHSGRTSLEWTIHHALYDGWSMPMLLRAVQQVYHGVTPGPFRPFQRFVQHVLNMDGDRSRAFWTEYCANLQMTVYPSLPSQNYVPRASSAVEHRITKIMWSGGDITPATSVRTAWALLQAQYTGADDVVYGVVSSGRQADVSGVDCIVGPTIATVPARVRLDREATVQSIQHEVQRQAVMTIPYEQTGVSRIRGYSKNTRQACTFQTLVVIQPRVAPTMTAVQNILQAEESDDATGSDSQDRQWDAFTTYGLMVVCELDADEVRLRLCFDDQVLDAAVAWRMTQQFEHILCQLCAPECQRTSLADVDCVNAQDRADIWRWNATVPETMERCVPDLIEETIRRQPMAPAICAWDGELTYNELDALSTRLAHALAACGIGPSVVVPLCFEKSMWMPVAMLGVMKAGGVSLCLSQRTPRLRIRQIAGRINAVVALVSRRTKKLLEAFFECKDITSFLAEAPKYSSPRHLPGSTLKQDTAVIFTSGTSGDPKGIFHTHLTLAANAYALGEVFGLGPQTRAFQYASYEFDVSIYETYGLFIRGGCLCIPCDEDRSNCPASAIVALRANFWCTTPSASLTVQPDEVPGLRTVIFAGERLEEKYTSRWPKTVRLHNWYGPAECPVATSCRINEDLWRTGDIGRGVRGSCWIVDQRKCEALAAIGCIGELVVEGDILAERYTTESEAMGVFLEDPPWLVAGGGGVPGRHGRLYRTGDLVRYNTDGSLHFIGRKDAQVKIRGQRVELSEVEHHVERALAVTSDEEHDLRMPLVAEVVTPQGGQPTLVVFADVSGFREANRSGDKGSEKRAVLAQRTIGIDERLAEVVPAYMIPAAYVAVRHIPLTATGKTDRRQLRKMAECWTTEELADQNAARAADRRPPSTSMEQRLQALWAQVLGVPADSIAAGDSFLRVGGDSIQAMRLVAAAREQELSLTVADVFAQPCLSRLATTLEHALALDDSSPVPFSLLPAHVELQDLLRCAKDVLEPANQVQDVYPATSMQVSYLHGALITPPTGCHAFYLDLPSSTNIDAARACCNAIWVSIDILRAVFVEHSGRYWNIISHSRGPSPINVSENEADLEISSEKIFRQALDQPLQLGTPYTKFFIVVSPGYPVRLGMRLCHAQYDGVSFQTLVNIVGRTLDNLQQEYDKQPPFTAYIRHAQQNEAASLLHWSKLLQGSAPLPFLSARLRSIPGPPQSMAAEVLECKARVHHSHNARDSTIATSFAAACALALSYATDVEDVVFGLVVTGRASVPANLISVYGPCLGVIPIRLRLRPGETLDEAIVELHRQRTESRAFETSTFANILQACTDWPTNQRQYSCIIQFQDIEEEPSWDKRVRHSVYRRSLTTSQPALVVFARPVQGELEISVLGGQNYYERHELKSVLDTVARLLCGLDR